MAKAIVVEIGGTFRRVPHLKRRWVFLRPLPEGPVPDRRAAQGR